MGQRLRKICDKYNKRDIPTSVTSMKECSDKFFSTISVYQHGVDRALILQIVCSRLTKPLKYAYN